MSKVRYPLEIDGIFIGTKNEDSTHSVSSFELEIPRDSNRWHKNSYSIKISIVLIYGTDMKTIIKTVVLGSSINAKSTENMNLVYNNSPIIGYKCLSDDEIKVFKEYLDSEENIFLKLDNYEILTPKNDLTKESFW